MNKVSFLTFIIAVCILTAFISSKVTSIVRADEAIKLDELRMSEETELGITPDSNTSGYSF